MARVTAWKLRNWKDGEKKWVFRRALTKKTDSEDTRARAEANNSSHNGAGGSAVPIIDVRKMHVRDGNWGNLR